MRTFIAVTLSKEYSNYYRKLKKKYAPLDSHARFVHEDQLHLTLHYLGDIDFKQMRKVEKVFKNVLERRTPFVITLGEIDFFKKKRDEIMWQGINLGSEDLEVLYALLKKELIAQELPYGDAFTPHITFARKIKRREFYEDIPFYQPFEIIDQVVLFLSTSQSGTLEYIPIIKQKLGGYSHEK